MYEQALVIHGENPYYRNECARTKYMLGCVQVKHGDSVCGQATLGEARQLLSEIRPDVDVTSWNENEYDSLVMPWSR